jgi:hypothetical protein
VAVDPAGGDVYVAELDSAEEGGVRAFGERVQKFTATGEFVLEIGKEVNETTKGNLCTQAEVEKVEKGVKCKGPALRVPGAPYEWGGEHGSFNFQQGDRDILAVGPAGLLYVCDEGRVQEFEANGTYKGEISLAGTATAIAVDKTGDAYLLEGAAAGVIREFDPGGKEITQLQSRSLYSSALAFDPAGRLAVAEQAEVAGQPISRGSLYDVTAGQLRLITEFTNPDVNDIAFDGEDRLFATTEPDVINNGYEVIAYTPVPVGELVSAPGQCAAGAEHETDATLDCTLKGEIDAWGVKETEVWFQWGITPLLGEKTPQQPVVNEKPKEGEEEAPVKVSARVEGLRPNETFYYRLAGEDHNVKTPELLTGETISFKAPTAPPRIVGTPSVSYVHSSSAVMFGELNPENTNTRYEFQYVPYGACGSLEESCPGMAQTPAQESPAYGTVATTLEATGLQPATTYRYRLFAVNQGSEPAVNETGGSPLPEGTFATAPAPVPRAQTGAAGAITATGAVVSGMVDPDGVPASYAFELGVYVGASTQYGIVFSGPAGASSIPVEKTLSLTGLQPGTTYAYRIEIESGYGTAQGETATFTTAGLPSVLVVPSVLAQLAVPPIAFPPATTTTTTKALTNAQKLAKALKACKKDKSKKQRAACQKQARKKYPKSKQANNRKKG